MNKFGVIFLLVFLIMLSSSALILIKIPNFKNPFLVNPLASFGNFISSSYQSEIPKQKLSEVVQNELENVDGSFGLAVINLNSGESYFYKENIPFPTASLYKLWVMGEAYHQIEDGKISEDEVLSQDIAVLNQKFEIDQQYAEQTEGTITLTTTDALNQMITISHNYAALLLSEKLRMSAVNNYIKNNNFSQSSLGQPPTTTTADMAKFLEKLYKGQLANKENTEKMITLLKNQKINSKLPKYLPSTIEVAHKTGELNTVSHDAGIVYTPKGNYIIVILSDTNNQNSANEVIANISKVVYKHFTE